MAFQIYQEEPRSSGKASLMDHLNQIGALNDGKWYVVGEWEHATSAASTASYWRKKTDRFDLAPRSTDTGSKLYARLKPITQPV